MYAIVENGRVVNTAQTMQQMFINNCFPPSGTQEWMLEHNVYEVIYPNYNPSTHQLAAATPQITGTRVMIHQVVPIPPQPEPEPQAEAQPEPAIEPTPVGADTTT
jgi:hypothetical protein